MEERLITLTYPVSGVKYLKYKELSNGNNRNKTKGKVAVNLLRAIVRVVLRGIV